MAIESGLEIEEQEQFSTEVGALTDKLPIARSPEQRLTALLLAVWADASKSGITSARLAMMALKAFNDMKEAPPSSGVVKP